MLLGFTVGFVTGFAIALGLVAWLFGRNPIGRN